MLVVVRSRTVSAEPAVTWRYLTQPRLVSTWFADCHRLEPGGAFRFDFGDGDFFCGVVRAWREPEELALAWRFMGAGPLYEIRYTVRAGEGGSEVEVRDRGAATSEEAAALSEGWDDFLMRLAAAVRTGQPVRYEWSPQIGAGAVLHGTRRAVLEPLLDAGWWAAAFPGARPRQIHTDAERDELLVTLVDDAWAGRQTVVAVSARRADGGALHLTLVHSGWDELERERRIPERRRCAESWARALQELEKRYPAPRP
jgi:uncharacterized protein YndB with AHSA1/START domain